MNHADLSVLDPTPESLSGRVPRTSRVYHDDENKCLQLLHGAQSNKFEVARTSLTLRGWYANRIFENLQILYANKTSC